MELALGPFSHLDVSERVIKSELQKRGYRRHPAHNKPPVSELTRRRRTEWASAHIDWTVEDWRSILWTDETWVKDGQHTRDWITRTVSTMLFGLKDFPSLIS